MRRLAGDRAADPRRALLLSDVADSLAALDVHDGIVARPDSGSLSARGSADQQIAIGSAYCEREAVQGSNDDRFFDANEDADSEDGAAYMAAHAQEPSSLLDAALTVPHSGDGPGGKVAGSVGDPAPETAQSLLGMLETPLVVQSSAGGHTSVDSQAGQAGTPATPLPADSPGDIASVVAAAVSAASISASEASFGPAAGRPPASASSIGLSVRSSVTFPSLAELASPVTPDFAMQVRPTGSMRSILALTS